MHIANHAIGFGVTTALGLCVVAPASAAPVLISTAVLKSAVDNTTTEVRYLGRGRVRAAVGVGVGLAVAGAAASYAYGYPYGSGYQSYGYGYPSSYGYAPSTTTYSGYAPYNYGYSGYSYNYGYTPGYYGYGARGVARRVARRAYYRR